MHTQSAILRQHIEALIFASPQPISTEEIQECLEQTLDVTLQQTEVQEQIDQLSARYQQEDRAIEIAAIGGGYQMLTKGAYHPTVGTYLKMTTQKRLSRAALETLSIVAYKQPVTKAEMEKIRGVNCDYTVQKLLEKELVVIVGREETPGRPLLYGTSERFMDYFGLNTLKDLPQLKDFQQPESEIGEAAPLEVDLPRADEEE